MKIDSLKLENVRVMPEILEPGILYYSEEYGLCIHLCACGCGNKTVTPTRAGLPWLAWQLTEGPTLFPSIGNMQICGAHYWVRDGKIVWC